MKRPAILDEDVVVVPSRPIAWFVKDFADGWIYFDNNADANLQINATGAISLAGFSASPHATEWAEVKAYVDRLERNEARASATLMGLLDALEHHTGERHGIMAIRHLVDRAEAAEARLKEAERVIGLAEEYIIDGITTAKEQYEMNAPYPAREPGYRAALDGARAAHAAARTWMEGK